MADEIIRTIYKLEIDDSGYIRGVESLSSSTNKFAQIQDAANKALKLLESALAEQSKSLQKAKQDLDSYTGADEKYRQQLLKTFNDHKANNDKLVGLVSQARQEYEKATKAAQDFANTSARANNLQQQPGARIAPLPPPPSVAASLNAQIFNTIDLTEMYELAEITAKTKTEFDELADSILLAEERLKQLDPASEEFKQLAPIVEQGNKALKEYDQAAKGISGSTKTVRAELRQAKEDLVRLEQAGKGASKEYFELEKRTAKLTDAFNDQQARTRILASDTKLLDFGKGAITAATSAFQAYTAVSILAGDQSEELQKKTMQLFAAMQLLQSLEQLSNLTRREGVLATLAQSAAHSTYTAVVGASTGVLRAFRIALAATGIGAVIAGIAFLVIKFKELAEAQREANEQQKLLQEINEEAIKSFSAQVTHLTLIKQKLTDLNVPQKERIRLAKEYNKTAEEGNKIDLKQIDNIALVNAAIDTQIKAIERRARAKAAENVLTQRFETLFLAQEAARVKAEQNQNLRQLQSLQQTQQQGPELKVGDVVPVFDPKSGRLKDVKLTQKDIDEFKEAAVDANLKIANQLRASGVEQAIQNDPDVKAAQDAVNKALSLGLINIDDLITPTGGKDTKAVENVFAQRLRELQAKLAEVTAKSFESEGTIRKQFQASLIKEIASINELVKDKKLTKDQATVLIELTTRINDVQLQEALDQFNKKVTDARNKLNEELRDLQRQNTEDSIQLLQDEFERRKLLIDFNEKQQLEDAQRNTDERLAALEEQRDLVGEQAYQDAKNRIVQAGEDAQTNIIIEASQQRQQLAIDSFKKVIDGFNDALFNSDLINDKNALEDIQALSRVFLTGKITYEQYKKDLQKIQKKYEDIQLQNTIDVLEQEIRELNRKINNTLDLTEKQYDDLIKLVKQKEAELVAAKTKQAVVPPPDDNTNEIQKFVDTANAIGAVADSVVQFWVKANEAEAAALDRSIALQERRIDAAQRIAERGNAQYLKAEEDRLKELEIARENAARRQLAIDAALQASQILVGITGAIAKIATPGIGIAETLGSIAVIVGALATGYGLVKSLQGNQPRFFKGTKYLERDGHPSGRDTIPAMLHEGEAVIPTETNKKYHPTISAIYDGKIHPDVINNFVQNYHTVKRVPQVNYERIKEAAELKVSHDGKMAVILNEHSGLLRRNNELQEMILKKNIKVENKIDREGVASMVTEFMAQKEIDKRV